MDLCILNGRKNGDLFGNFTSFQWNGNGLVDYAISSQSLFSRISTFSVGNYKPWISDHCAIHHSLQVRTNITPKEECKLNSHPKSWHWNENSSKKYIAALKSAEISKKIDVASNLTNPNEIISKVNDILVTAAKNSSIKQKKQRSQLPNNSANNPWYDQDCVLMKIDIKKKSILVKRNPTDSKGKEELFSLQRKYKNLTKKKKRNFRENILNGLNLGRKNSREFWKTLNKLNENSNDDIFKNGISANRWTNHFKSIFTSKQNLSLPETPNETGPLDFEINKDELMKADYILRPGKGTGIDVISNEMISCLLQNNPEFLLKVFNNTSIFKCSHKCLVNLSD